MTTMLGVTRPAVAPLFPLRRKSNLLFHFRATDLLLGHAPAEEVLQSVTGDTPTFTRTTTGGYTRGRDGILMQWPLDVPRLEMYDLDSDGVFETPALVMEGQRENIILRSEEIDNGAWTNTVGTPGITANDVEAPDGAVTAEKIEDDDAGVVEERGQLVTIANDSTAWCASVFVKKAAGTPVIGLRLRVTGGSVFDFNFLVDPSDGQSVVGGGRDSGVIDHGGWWRIWVTFDNDSSGNVGLSLRLMAAARLSGDLGSAGTDVTAVGSNHFWGTQVENAPFPSSYIRTVASSVVRNVDDLTYSLSWLGQAIIEGLDDLTVYARIPRPIHADVTGATSDPVIMLLSSAVPTLQTFFDGSARNLIGQINTATTDATASAALPADDPLELLAQYRNLRTGGGVAVDTGSGLGAFVDGATIFSAYANSVARISGTTGFELYGAINELKVARGLRTLKQMQEAA